MQIVPASLSGLGLGGELPRPPARRQSESEPGLPRSLARSEYRAGLIPPAAAAAAARDGSASAQALLADDRESGRRRTLKTFQVVHIINHIIHILHNITHVCIILTIFQI